MDLVRVTGGYNIRKEGVEVVTLLLGMIKTMLLPIKHEVIFCV